MLNKGLSEKHPFNFNKTSPLRQLSITDNSFGPKATKILAIPTYHWKLVSVRLHQQGGDNHL